MIFSEKNIYKKLVCYTGTLTEGRMRLTPPIRIVGFLMLIDMRFRISININSSPRYSA